MLSGFLIMTHSVSVFVSLSKDISESVVRYMCHDSFKEYIPIHDI